MLPARLFTEFQVISIGFEVDSRGAWGSSFQLPGLCAPLTFFQTFQVPLTSLFAKSSEVLRFRQRDPTCFPDTNTKSERNCLPRPSDQPQIPQTRHRGPSSATSSPLQLDLSGCPTAQVLQPILRMDVEMSSGDAPEQQQSSSSPPLGTSAAAANAASHMSFRR